MNTPHSYSMSLNEKTDKPSMDKLTHRLYPSLPNIDSYDRCVGEKLPAAADLRPERLQEDTQPEACGADGDRRLKAQILILVEQRRELISINDKWAKEYQTMVRFYREKTCGDGDVNSELLKVKKEARELRGQNSTLTRRGQHQHEEIRRLNKALEEALETTPPLGGSSETPQDLWKHQAEVYREDFLTERKDREKLKEKYLELENRFRKVRTELRVLNSQVTWSPPPQPVLERVCSNRVKCLNQQHVQIQRRQLS